MERIFSQFESTYKKPDDENLDREHWKRGEFSDTEKEEIEKKRKLLSTLVYFIGKDFKMPVEINSPGQGWHWDFAQNVVRIDPIDLLEKPLDYLRFVISHEGGHRRISRTEFIPLEIWRQPGFSFMMNAVEDPRDNNFVAENYPKFKEQMQLAYNHDLDLETKTKERAQEKLGYQPRHLQAGFEYIKQWFNEIQNKETKISSDLPEEVKNVLIKTLKFAHDSWWRYPSKEEADKSEDLIKRYAKKSYEINLNKIWPEYKNLVDQDMADQKMQEFIKGMQPAKAQNQKSGATENESLPQDLKDKLNEEEQKELAEAIRKALKATKDQNGTENKEEPMSNQPIDLGSLSEELKQKIKDHLESLPEDKKKELIEKAEQELKNFDQSVADDLAGKISDDPEKKVARDKAEAENPKTEDKIKDKKENKKEDQDRPKEPTPIEKQKEFKAEAGKMREQIEKSLNKDNNAYEVNRREVLPVINKLETELREIFVKRQANKWQSGFRVGKKIDLGKRMQEKAKGLSAVESKAWQKREAPTEKDYAITLLIDLSGSMEGKKIKEAFKSTIILAEVLNRLSIKTEILGFNDRLYEYQNYGQVISKNIRENMGGMLKEIGNRSGGRASYNDDGWALNTASERLDKQNVKEKILIVLSDGRPEPSPQHNTRKFDLNQIVEKINNTTDQKLIGLGILSDAVSSYYPENLPNIKAEDLGQELAKKIKAVIEADNKPKD
jgi:cobalamin biosynthesis protein CobT